MTAKHYIEYGLVKLLLGLCRILPQSAVYSLFKNLTLLLYSFMKRRRALTLKNLSIAFPEKSEDERKSIAKKSFLNVADSMALNTLIMTGRISNDYILNTVELDENDWNTFLERKAQHKMGTLVITGHLGNWELLPQYAGLRLDEQLHAIARKSDNQLIEEKIIFPLRQRFGMDVYYKKNALMHIMKAAKKGDISALLLDQKLRPPTGFPCEFFGKPAPTGGSPALLQIRFGIPIQPVFMVKTAPHQHKIILPAPIPWEDNGKPMEEQVQELTRLHQAMMEEVIRQYPDQWFWMHNRWDLKKDQI